MIPLDYYYSPQAIEDLESILRPLTEKSPRAADRLAEAIDSTIKLARTRPLIGEQSGHPCRADLRRLLVERYHNYSVYYEVRDDVLIVIRVFHNARDVYELIDE